MVKAVSQERGFASVESGDILTLVESCDAQRLLYEFPASIYRDAVLSIPEFILNRNA
jgi:hypothetical protein